MGTDLGHCEKCYSSDLIFSILKIEKEYTCQTISMSDMWTYSRVQNFYSSF